MLIVEDDSNDLELELRALQQIGLNDNIHIVRDGAEALDFLFSSGKYSGQQTAKNLRLIVIDLKLPKVDGFDVIAAVKSDDRTKRIPVVVLSSSREDCDIVRSVGLGVSSYVAKPVEFDKFINTVSQIGRYWLKLNEYLPQSRQAGV